jgi:hypothetical protein
MAKQSTQTRKELAALRAAHRANLASLKVLELKKKHLLANIKRKRDAQYSQYIKPLEDAKKKIHKQIETLKVRLHTVTRKLIARHDKLNTMYKVKPKIVELNNAIGRLKENNRDIRKKIRQTVKA